MFKTIGKLALVGLVVVGGLTMLKSSSYVCTVWNNARKAVARQVPRELEIDRARLEISKLDGDVRNLLGPIAEKIALVKKLDKDVANAQENIKAQREALVALTREVETGEAVVTVKGEEFTMKQAKAKLARDFASLKRGETALKSQEKLLTAHRQNLTNTKDQLNVMLDQKREFEVRLAQLEATEAELNLAKSVTPLRVDDTRLSGIKAALDAIEQGQEVDNARLDLEKQWAPRLQNGQAPVGNQPATVDVNEVKSYLGIDGSKVVEK